MDVMQENMLKDYYFLSLYFTHSSALACDACGFSTSLKQEQFVVQHIGPFLNNAPHHKAPKILFNLLGFHDFDSDIMWVYLMMMSR